SAIVTFSRTTQMLRGNSIHFSINRGAGFGSGYSQDSDFFAIHAPSVTRGWNYQVYDQTFGYITSKNTLTWRFRYSDLNGGTPSGAGTWTKVSVPFIIVASGMPGISYNTWTDVTVVMDFDLLKYEVYINDEATSSKSIDLTQEHVDNIGPEFKVEFGVGSYGSVTTRFDNIRVEKEE
ncbi:MAG: hypothetical protein QME81_19775, partial [bacterium]|nr:hypothetical protein [bacterium]